MQNVIEDARFAILSRHGFFGVRSFESRCGPGHAERACPIGCRRTENCCARVFRATSTKSRSARRCADRAADMIAEFGGSWKFIGASMGLIGSGSVFNSYILFRGFDPAPYQMLNLVLAVIAGMQAPIIMMSQNRQGEKDRLARGPGLPGNLKNELSLAEVLRRLDVFESERLPRLFEEQNARLSPKSQVR